MAIRGSAAKYSHSTLAAPAIPKSRHDGKAGQPSERLDVIWSLHSVVEVFAQERQADASDQPNQKSESNIAGLGGARGIRRNHGRVDDTEVGRFQPFGDARFLQFRQQAFIEGLVRFRLSFEDV